MHAKHEQWKMKAGEKDYLKESNGTKANCNTNVTQVWKSRIYSIGDRKGGFNVL